MATREIITGAHVFTMEGEGVGYLADTAVVIEDDRIAAVGPEAELLARHPDHARIDGRGCALIPGLIDAHMHTPLAVLRGVAQDVAHWMQRALAPYTRHLDRAASLAGTRLNILEALRSGTTTFGDYTRPYPGWAETFVDAGVRAVLTPTINALPPGGMAGWRVGDLYPLDDGIGRRAIERAVAFCRDWDGAADGRISAMLGPQAADMVTREQLIEIRRIAEREDWLIHMHVAQGDRETEQLQQRYGQRTPAFLDEIGLLDERLVAVHLTEATEAEAEHMARTGTRMVLCSGSIGIIDGIVPPAHAFRRAGGPVALGSDQASGNNCSNLFNEMKLTALFNKIRHRDPTVMPAWEVLRMATVEGARALGLDDRVGRIHPGLQADLVLVDLAEPNLTPVLGDPVRNIVPNLVYAATGREVRQVWVAGRTVVAEGRVLTLDGESVVADAQAQALAVSRSVAADPDHRQMVLLEAMDSGRL